MMMDFHGSKMRDLVAILLCYALFQAVSGTLFRSFYCRADTQTCMTDLAVAEKADKAVAVKSKRWVLASVFHFSRTMLSACTQMV